MTRLSIQWAPVDELVTSLRAFLARKQRPILDLGPAWAKSVRTSLGPSQVSKLTALTSDDTLVVAQILRSTPGAPGDSNAFIGWMRGLSSGDLHERVAPRLTAPTLSLLADLGQARDRASDALHIWQEGYFRAVDPAILRGLATSALDWSIRIADMDPVEALERMTNGVVLQLTPPPAHVLLIPQYHFQPWNLFTQERSTLTIHYPAELELAGPPRHLLRLARALSDESRLNILRHLRSRPCSLTDLAALTGLSKPTVYHHTVVLRAAGLIRTTETNLSARRPRPTYTLRPDAGDILPALLHSYLEADNR